MTAVIHQFPNYEHEAKVLALRRRLDREDPLWRANALARTALVRLRPEPRAVSRPSGDHRLSRVAS